MVFGLNIEIGTIIFYSKKITVWLYFLTLYED